MSKSKEELWVDLKRNVFSDRYFFNNDQTNLILEKKNGDFYSIYKFDFSGTERGFKLLFSHRHEIRCVDFRGNKLLVVDSEKADVVKIYDLRTEDLIFEISSDDTLKDKERGNLSQVRKSQFLNDRTLVILYENGKLKLVLFNEINQRKDEQEEEEEEEQEGEEDEECERRRKLIYQTYHFEALLPYNLFVNNFCVSGGTNIAFSSYTNCDQSKSLFFLVKFEPVEDEWINEGNEEIDVEKYLTKNFSIVETSVDQVFFSRTKEHILACSEDGVYFHLYDLSLRKKTSFYRGKNSAVVKSIAFSDSFLAVLTDRLTLHVFSLNTGDNPKPYLHGISKGFTYEKSFSMYYITPPSDIMKNNTNTHDYQLCRFTNDEEIFVIGNRGSFYLSFDRTKPGEPCTLVEGRVFSGFSKSVKNLRISINEFYLKVSEQKQTPIIPIESYIHPRNYYFFRLYPLHGRDQTSFKSRSYRGSVLLDNSETVSFYMNLNTKEEEEEEVEPNFPSGLRLEVYRDKTMLKNEKLKGFICISLPKKEEFIKNMSFGYDTKLGSVDFEDGSDMNRQTVFSKLSICAVDFGLDMSGFKNLFTDEWVRQHHVLVRILEFLDWKERCKMKIVSKYLQLVVVECFEKKK